jgi:hypothetical protein
MTLGQRCAAVGFSLAALPLLAGYAADIAPALKPGLWQTTTSVRAAGAHEWSEAELAQLPPEERAHYEDAMKVAVAQGAQSHTFTSCLTAEELRGDLTFNFEHNPACKRTVVSTSATSWEIHEACAGAAQRTASAHFSATSPGEISGETIVSLIKGERRLVSKGIVHSKWLGADCGSVRPGKVIQQPNGK